MIIQLDIGYFLEPYYLTLWENDEHWEDDERWDSDERG